jgi:spectinomycin phosphotransferase
MLGGMLEPPDIADDAILSSLRDAYGVAATRLRFLPLGSDVGTAVYRVRGAAGASWFLKLRRGPFTQASVALPRLLADRGVAHVIAPLPALDGGLSAPLEAGPAAEPFSMILYPFVEGRSGFAAELDEGRWTELGAFLRRLHDEPLPHNMREAIPREAWSPEAREQVREALARPAERTGFDAPAAELAALLESRRGEIGLMVDRAERLATALQRAAPAFVLCHTDIHAGNVLVADEGGLFVVDWDDLLFAPRERDLMFVGGGVGGVWNKPDEEAWFHRGYGEVSIDPAALAYYRYERIVQDVAAYCRLVFGRERGDDDRRRGVRQLAAQFLPGGVVEIAHRTFRRL